MRGAAFALALTLLGGCATAPFNSTHLPDAARTHPQDYVVVAVRNDSLALNARAGATLRGYDGVGHYGPSADSRRLIAAVARDYGLQTVAGWPIDALHLECVVFRIGAGSSSDDLLARLGRDPRVRVAEPLQNFETLASYDDPYVELQKNVPLLGLADAHRLARGTGVRIAVVDTGVSADHPDLGGSVIEEHDFVGGDVFRHDVHGTLVAGVIAARANNHIGIVGVAPESQIIALKACWESSGTAHAVCNTFTLAQAISSAVNSKARIVNLSLTGPADGLLTQIVSWGIGRGVIFVGAVAASGRLDTFPANIPAVLAVDSAESPRRAPRVIYAPGEGILTLTPDAHYDFASGSSLAAAEVSGLVALMLEHRAFSADDARDILIASMPRTETLASVNACAALALALNQECAAAGWQSAGSAPSALHGAIP